MRTTLTIEDGLMTELKERAHRSGRTFKEVVNEAIRSGLEAGGRRPRAKPYRLQPASLGDPAPGVDLARALAVADILEDEETRRKLEARK